VNKKKKKAENSKKRNFWTINPITRRTKTKKEKIESAETKHRKVVNYEI
jgi:hypothetical protein